MAERIKVLFMSAEAEPLVKVGGLGDVAGTLPLALRQLPEKPDVRLVLPFHSTIPREKYANKPVAVFSIGHVDGPQLAEVFETAIEGMPVYLVAGKPISESPDVYSSDGLIDGNKYIFFSLAALELARVLDWQPDILHAQDWHTAPAVYSLKFSYEPDHFFKDTATLLTVHNLPFLGEGAGPAMAAYGLPPVKERRLPDWAKHLPLPLGLLAADKISTVSPGYAAEMLTPEFGAGLQDFLITRKKDLVGILNGLDMQEWDPAGDNLIPANYDVQTLSQRVKNKRTLQGEVGLAFDQDIPLLSIISRMDHQKGIDLAVEALRQLSGEPWQAVILGSGSDDLENDARRLSMNFPQQVKTHLLFDSEMAHRIYAGADMILIPSRYEPCGLIQMIGMRYGCVPVARATGGLRDTVLDYSRSGKGTGFLFNKISSDALVKTIKRALAAYEDKRRWLGIQRRGMKQDFSWERSAKIYLDLYKTMITERKADID
jgi:starch synthase